MSDFDAEFDAPFDSDRLFELGPYTPPSAPAAIVAVDPATEVLSGYWLDGFAGVPYAGTASAGASAGLSLDEATNPPTPSASQNGHVGSNFDGVLGQLIAGGGGFFADSLISSTGYYYAFVVRPRFAAVDAGAGSRYANTLIFGDSSSNFGLSFSNVGFSAFQYDLTVGWLDVTVPAGVDVYHYVEVWHDGTYLNLRVDGILGPPRPVPMDWLAAYISALDVQIGDIASYGPALDGAIQAMLMAQDPLDETRRDGFRRFFYERYYDAAAVADGVVDFGFGTIADEVDPASLPLTHFALVPFAGTPWAGIASAGGSSGGNDQIDGIWVTPSIGAPVNGFDTLQLNGVDQALLAEDDTTTTIGLTGWTYTCVVRMARIDPDLGAFFVNPALFTDSGVAVAVAVGANGAAVGQRTFADDFYYQTTGERIDQDVWTLVQASWDGSARLKLRTCFNGVVGGWQAIAIADLSGLPFAVWFGVNYSQAAWLAGRKATDIFAAESWDEAKMNGVGLWLQTYLALDFGFVGEGVTGTGALAMRAFAVSGTGTVTFSGAAAIAFARLALAASGTQSFSGTAAINSARFAVAATGAETFSGTCAITVPSFTCSASGTYTPIPISGTCALTWATCTVSASGTEVFSGSCAIASPAFSVAASGTYTPLAITGSAAIEFARLAVSATGTQVFTGAAAIVVASLAVAATGELRFEGTGALALAVLALAASGDLRFEGAAAIELARLALSAAGTHQQNVTGTAAIELAAFVLAATGEQRFEGAAAIALAALEVDAAGALSFEGSAAIDVARLALAAIGTYTPVPISGEAAIELAPWTLEAFGGTAEFVGYGAIELAPFAVSASGLESFEGSAAIAVSPFAVSGTGELRFTGTGAIALRALAIDASGHYELIFYGAAALEAPRFSVSGTGAQRFDGTVAVELAPWAVAAAGAERFEGTAGIALRPFEVAASGAYTPQAIEGTGAIAASSWAVSAAGDYVPVPIAGDGALTWGAFTVAGTGVRLVGAIPTTPAVISKILVRVAGVTVPLVMVGVALPRALRVGTVAHVPTAASGTAAVLVRGRATARSLS